MITTFTSILATELLAWNGCNARSGIDNKSLRLALGAKIYGDVIVHEIGRIAVERGRLQMHVRH